MAAVTSCGVLVTDGARLLLGHATASPRWDIPKGIADPGEEHLKAAARELREETGLDAPLAELEALGLHRYRPGKDLALFRWRVAAMPDPAGLSCASTFIGFDGRVLPEFDRFAVVRLADVERRIGRSLAEVLRRIGIIGPQLAGGISKG